MALLARTVRSLARPAHSRLLRSARPQRAQAPSTLPRTLSTAAVALDDEAEWAAAFVEAEPAALERVAASSERWQQPNWTKLQMDLNGLW